MLNRAKWFVVGVSVAVILSGGIIYAAVASHNDGVKVYGKGIAVGNFTNSEAGTIKFPDGTSGGTIYFGDYTQGSEENYIAGWQAILGSVECMELGAYQIQLIGDSGSVVMNNTGASLEADSGCSVEAKSNGDVVVTLGS